MSSLKSASVVGDSMSICLTGFLVVFTPINVIVHSHEDDLSFELLGFALQLIGHDVLNLFEDTLVNAGKVSTAQFHLLSIDSIQFSEIASSQEPIDLLIPGIDWISTHTSQAQH